MAVTKDVVLVLALALVIAHCDIIDNPQDEIEDYVAVEEDTFLDYVEKRGECNKPNAKENRSVQQLNKDMLKWHKYYRCLHGVPKLSYSTALEQKARQHVEQLLQQGTFEHIKPNNYGENLWTMRAYPEFGIGAITGEDPVKAWYDEIDDPGYDFNRPTMFTSGTGHFSQVVWKDTKRLGCWVGERKNYPSQGWTRVVVGCEYDPPGNVGSVPAYWKEMVPPLK